MANGLTGLSGPPDKSSYSFFQRNPRLSWEELDAMYIDDPMAARIVNRIVEDALRTSWKLVGTDIPIDMAKLKSDLADRQIDETLGKIWTQGRKYGGCLGVLSAQDGGKMNTPLDLSKVMGLNRIQVVSSPWVQPDTWDGGLGSFGFATPTYYNFLLPSSENGRITQIHRSRVIRIDAIELDGWSMMRYGGWAPSALQSVQTSLRQLGEVLGYCRAIMHDASIEVYKLTNYRNQACGSPGEKDNLREYFEQIRLMKDVLHMLVIDGADSLESHERNLSGLDSMIDRFVDALVRSTPEPRSVLLGETPGGLNANADSEIRSWYDYVDSQRKKILNPALDRILQIHFAIRWNRTGEAVPTRWTIEWDPLWQPTAAEAAETDLKVAQTAQIYLASGVMKSEEIRNKLVSQGYITPVADVVDPAVKTVGPAQVGVWTGVTALLGAAFPMGIPKDVLARTLTSLDPERYPEAVAHALLATQENPEDPRPLEAGPALIADTPEASPEAMPSQAPVPPDLCSTKEAAARLGIPTLTVNNMCRNGTLPYWGFGSHKQVSMADVLAMGKAHEMDVDPSEPIEE